MLFGRHNVRPNMASFNIFIQGLCKTRVMDVALFLSRIMNKYGHQKDLLLYKNLIDGLCASDRLTESCEVPYLYIR